MIREIGEWVLRQACSDARRWLDAGLPFGRVAVNVAGPQLQTPDFAERVSRVLAGTGLPPSALELEVTETFVMDGTDSSVARLDALPLRSTSASRSFNLPCWSPSALSQRSWCTRRGHRGRRGCGWHPRGR